MTLYLRLYWEFFKTGLFAIGGGMATLPFLKDIGATTGWFSQTDLMNMLAVSESTPGPVGINMATYVGYTVGGVLIYSILTGHCIDYQQCLMHCHGFFDLLKFCHHVFIHMKSSGSIEDYYIMTVLLRICDRILCNLCRLVIRSHGEHIDFLLLTVDL